MLVFNMVWCGGGTSPPQASVRIGGRMRRVKPMQHSLTCPTDLQLPLLQVSASTDHYQASPRLSR